MSSNYITCIFCIFDLLLAFYCFGLWYCFFLCYYTLFTALFCPSYFLEICLIHSLHHQFLPILVLLFSICFFFDIFALGSSNWLPLFHFPALRFMKFASVTVIGDIFPAIIALESEGNLFFYRKVLFFIICVDFFCKFDK